MRCPSWWRSLLTCGWLACIGGSNYSVPVPGAAGGAAGEDNVLAGFEDDLSRTIVDCEVNADQWTLMHRYNKAAELIEQALQVVRCMTDIQHAVCTPLEPAVQNSFPGTEPC